MRTTTVFLLGMLAGAGAASLVDYAFHRSGPTHAAANLDRPHATDPTPSGGRQDPLNRAPMHEELRRQAGSVASKPAGPARLATTSDVLEPRADAEWDAFAEGMLEWEIERRTGVSAQKRRRLVSELARLREASLALQEAPAEPRDPAELRERLARTLTLVEVDRAFRRELGVGVAEFVRELNPDAVEDVARP